MAREYKVVAALQDTPVPVARAIALCEDDSVLGAPFQIVEFVAGQVVRRRAQLEALQPTVIDKCVDALIRVLVDLHNVDPDAVGLADFGKPSGYLERQVRRWGSQWELIEDRVLGARKRALGAPKDDFVVWRSDDVPSYHLAVVVDDESMRIGEIVRGDDLLDCTPLQLSLIRALDFTVPRYAHVPLWMDGAGNRFAKRDRSAGLANLRDSGMKSKAVVGILAASCGIVESDVVLSARDLVAVFKPDFLRPAPIVHDAVAR